MTTYKVEVTRDERWWMIHIPEIDGLTQARRIDEIEDMARSFIAVDTDTPLPDVHIIITGINVPELGDVRADALYVKGLREHAAELEDRAVRDSAGYARRLTAAGVPVRDVAELLDISPQRVSQLANS